MNQNGTTDQSITIEKCQSKNFNHFSFWLSIYSDYDGLMWQGYVWVYDPCNTKFLTFLLWMLQTVYIQSALCTSSLYSWRAKDHFFRNCWICRNRRESLLQRWFCCFLHSCDCCSRFRSIEFCRWECSICSFFNSGRLYIKKNSKGWIY